MNTYHTLKNQSYPPFPLFIRLVEVMDDEDKSITAGAIVTVRVVLQRQPMQKALNVGLSNGALISLDVVNGDNHLDNETGGGGGDEEEEETPKKKAPVWKSKGKQKQKPKKKPQQQQRLVQRRKPAVETLPAKSSGRNDVLLATSITVDVDVRSFLYLVSCRPSILIDNKYLSN